jgi:hypothetical protein
VAKLFPPGTDTKEIAAYLRLWVANHRTF